MYLNRVHIAIGLAFFLSRPAATAELDNNFDGKTLDTKVWNDCQIDQPPLTFEELTGSDGVKRRVLRNVVNPSTGNKDSCEEFLLIQGVGAAVDGSTGMATVREEEPVNMGPSLIDPSPLDVLGVEECPKGSKDYQRNELRLQKRGDLVHDHTDAHWYSITFHADGEIPSCGSARWVLAQWKQEKDGPSPFLAERFDNGVLHVTVQNGGCRCVVAKAQGDFDAMVGLDAGADQAQMLAESKPIKCLRTDLDDNAPEQSCEPTEMKVLTLGGAAPPLLPDPKREWLRMTYFVRNGFDGRGQIDVYAGSQFVVRVVGSIGYKTDDPGKVKFKFGHYRDRIDGSASVSVDSLCFSKDVKVCAPDLNVMP